MLAVRVMVDESVLGVHAALQKVAAGGGGLEAGFQCSVQCSGLRGRDIRGRLHSRRTGSRQ